MGQLLFCSHALAKKPYDIESASLNIYSLEEMSYYLIHNAEFVEMDFVGRTFCDWVRTEIKEEGLACKLEEALEQGVPSYEFARILLEETGYATEAEQQAAMEIFRQLEEKDELSRHKLRADRLLRREKYHCAMEEYRWILQNQTEETQEAFLGDVSHNLGTAYANLFLFSQAADCYKTAYENNTNPSSKKSELFCLFLADKKEKQSERAKEYGIGTEQLKEYERELEAIKEQLPLDENVKKIRNLYEAYEKGTKEEIKAETKSEIYGIVHKWRQEYEKYGR